MQHNYDILRTLLNNNKKLRLPLLRNHFITSFLAQFSLWSCHQARREKTTVLAWGLYWAPATLVKTAEKLYLFVKIKKSFFFVSVKNNCLIKHQKHKTYISPFTFSTKCYLCFFCSKSMNNVIKADCGLAIDAALKGGVWDQYLPWLI